MVKHRVNSSAKDPKEIRKLNEFERRKKEAELINKIKRIVPFFKRNGKCNKKEFLRTVTGYVKLSHSFKNTSVQPLPLNLEEVFQSLVRSHEINVFTCDGDLNMIFCSESAFACLGYQQKEVNNRKLSSLVYGRDQDAFQRQINALKEDVIESMQLKDFSITCRMVMKNKSKHIPEGHHLVRVTGTIEYQKELVTQKVAIQKAKNTHLSIRYEDSPNHNSAIIIRGSIGLIKDPDSLTSQIDYMLINNGEYRLVMNPAGIILFACHRMVNNIGFTPEEVIGRSAYEFMCAADRAMSLFAHEGTLRDNEGRGVIVHRLEDVCHKLVYLQSHGRLEKTDETILFHITATVLSEEEGEKRLQEYRDQLMPQCYNKTVRELQAKVDNVASVKLQQLESQLAAAKMLDDNKAANSSNDRLKASTSSISSSPCASSMNSAFQGVLNESAENEFVEIVSDAQSSPPGPSSQSSTLSTPSSSLPTLSPSTSLPSSSTQSPLSQSPSSQPCSSQSPPTYSLSSQSLTPESQFTQSSTDSSSASQSSASLSINYPVYATMNPYVPPTVMNSFPTNQRILQNQYYQLGTNQLCGMTSGQNVLVTNPRQMHIIITAQCTIPDQQTFFSAPVNNPQIIFQPTFPQYQTYNYNQEIQNIVGLDINQELQRVNVNDFVSSLDYESEIDLKQ